MTKIEQSIREVTHLISLPEIYLKIRQLMDEPGSEIDDFAEIIRYDPSLSTTVLKIVNSAYFGFTGKIDNISRAINMLGIGQLHHMVLGISAISSMNLPNDIMPLKTFWRCSLLTGVLSRLLAEQLKIPQSERLFVIGLLHDIGHLVIYSKFPKQAKLAIQIALDDDKKIHQVEQELLGLHYGQVGALLMAQWDLPIIFQNLTHYQPTPQKTADNFKETAVLHLAHGYAQKQFIETSQNIDRIIDPASWEISQLSQKKIEETMELALSLSTYMEKVILG